MTGNLVMRLRWLCSPSAESLSDHHRITGFIREGYEAADEIDRLTRERETLREALRPFAALNDEIEPQWRDHETHWMGRVDFQHPPTIGEVRRARAALAETEKT